jgi:DNA-binding CsgD family transcriptional regulator
MSRYRLVSDEQRSAMTLDATLDQARQSFELRHWGDARAALAAADDAGSLAAADLERLAVSAYLTGHDDQSCDAWARAHRAFRDVDDVDAAVRCGFWMGVALMLRGQEAPAHGWLSRIRSVAADADEGSVAHAYVEAASGLVPLFTGDAQAALPFLTAAARLGDRGGEADMAALGRLGRGQSLIAVGQVAEGLAMLDEAMVAVAAGEVSPIPAGIIYCAVIEACQELFDLRRAREWTDALDDWCRSQPDLVPYRGQCLVHRAELLRFHGAWAMALTQAHEASVRLTEPPHPAAGAAFYAAGELHRLRGDVSEAEAAYRRAVDCGHSAQPGLGLLWFAQGKAASAAAAIERALGEPHFPATRAILLFSKISVLLGSDAVAAGRVAADELVSLCAQLGSPPMLAAMADEAIGAVLLAAGECRDALRHLRLAWTNWQAVDAPYESARARVQIGLACRGLGDDDSAAIELDAARQAFAQLGAVPDVARLDAISGRRAPPGGLTAREVEVLAAVATGSTNRAIAEELMISEKTVARHLSNIFTKLGVSSRAAATAYAYEHDLVGNGRRS